MKRIIYLLLLSCSIFFVGCSSGSDGGTVAPAGNNGANGGGTVAVQPASARMAIRTSQSLPGSVLAASDQDGPNPILAFFSSPAWAQTFFTIPGARVDALGSTFAFANAEGVAEFLSLPPRDYRFVVSTDDPGVVLQTLLVAGPGEVIEDTIDEFTTMSTLLAVSATRAFNAQLAGADLPALVSVFQQNQNTEFGLVRSIVENNLQANTDWLDNEFLPLSGSALEQAVTDANASETYRLAQIPFEGQLNYPTSPLQLAVVFNNPIDTSSLAPISGGDWSLQTPQGVIDSSNLSNFGTVEYTQTQQTVDGRVIPPNTLFFRLTGFASTSGSQQSFTLSLPTLPRDLQGRQVLSSRPASSFVNWSFQESTVTNPGAQVNSNATGSLTFQATACEGETNADLSPILPPSLLLAFATPNEFGFQYQQVEQPFRIPSTERVYQLRVRDSDTIQVGETYQIVRGDQSIVELFYEERDYLPGPAGNINFRFFTAVEGTVTITRLETGVVEATVDALFEAQGEAGLPSSASGSFCAVSQIVANLP